MLLSVHETLGLSSREVEERVREALDQVNLSFDELRDVSPFELSGGQQRRWHLRVCSPCVLVF